MSGPGEARRGILVPDRYNQGALRIIAGPENPTTIPVKAPISSVFLQKQTGKAFIKTGSDNTDWQELGAAPISLLEIQTSDGLGHTRGLFVLELSPDTVYKVNAEVVARRTDGGSDNAAYGRTVKIAVDNTGNATIGPIQQDFTDETDGSMNVTFTITAGSPDILNLEVTGITGQNYAWAGVVTIRSV